MQKLLQLQQQVTPRLTTITEAVNSVNAKIEDMQRSFLQQALKENSKATILHIFTLWSDNFTVEESTINMKNVKIRLLCEHPGSWHMVDDQYPLNDPDAFIKAVFSYLSVLLKVLSLLNTITMEEFS